MPEKDTQIETILNEIINLEQRQYNLIDQLYYLSRLAIKFGLYDADDFVKKYYKMYKDV